MVTKTAIIGCGNRNRCDDGVGPYVVDLLRSRNLPEDVALFDAGTNGMDVLYRARGVQQLIIVDAQAPGRTPGAIYEVPGGLLASAGDDRAQSLTLHDFRWDHALYAGRQIYGDDFPKDVSVFLVEAASLDLGLDLTAPVAAAADKVVTMIADIVNRPAIERAAS